ncbi:MAG: glycoside hydrolase N-terminal domain-containing protein [Candidatus Omnitrophota bacterium]
MMKIDWNSLLEQHDLIYEEAPQIWQDGFPIGNGDMGALVYAPSYPEWTINKVDVWDERHPKRKKVLTIEEVKEGLKKGLTSQKLDELESPGSSSGQYPTPKTCGQLRITKTGHSGILLSPAPAIKQRLHLYEARVSMEMDKHMDHPRLDSFISANRNVLVTRVKNVSPFGWRNELHLYKDEDVTLAKPKLRAEGNKMIIEQELPSYGERYVMVAKVVPTEISSTGEWDWVKKNVRKKYWPAPDKAVIAKVAGTIIKAEIGGDFEIYVSVVTSKESPAPEKTAKRIVDEASRTGFEGLLKEHKEWWRDFWTKSFIELDDKFLEELWYLSLYQLASCYRKAPVPGLLGLWFGPTGEPRQLLPWAGMYVNDLNAQIPPMPVFAANHPEIAEPFYETFLRMIPEARKTARKVYGLDGAYLQGCGGPNGKDNAGGWGKLIQCGGPYLGLIFCWGHDYTQDKVLLKEKVYPFIKEVLTFFYQYKTTGKDGKYRLYPSQAPEIPWLDCGNPTFTLSLLKVLLKKAIEAAQILDVAEDEKRKWEDFLKNFPEYPVEDGIFKEADEIPVEHYVGQSGGMYPTFPCGEIGMDSPENLRKIALKTYRTNFQRAAHISYADKRGYHFICLWTWFFSIITALRLGLKKEAWNSLFHDGLRCFLKPNGLLSHNPVVVCSPNDSEKNIERLPRSFLNDCGERMSSREVWCGHQGECTKRKEGKREISPILEGSSAYMMVIEEMLIQSYDGIIRIFPCYPKKLGGRFYRLRAKGAVLVSSEIEAGKVKYVVVESQNSGKVKVKNPWKGNEIYLRYNSGSIEMKCPGDIIVLKTSVGDRVILSEDKKEIDIMKRRTVPEGKVVPGPKMLKLKDGTRIWIGRSSSEYTGLPATS